MIRSTPTPIQDDAQSNLANGATLPKLQPCQRCNMRHQTSKCADSMELPTFTTPEEVSKYVFNLEDLTPNELNEVMKFFKVVGAKTTFNILFQKDIVFKKEGVGYHAVWRHTLEMMQESIKYPALMVIYANYLLVNHREIIQAQEKTIEERIEDEVQKRLKQMQALEF